MFVAMNRIFLNPDYAEHFEGRFKSRVGMVDKMEGFIRNQVLRPDKPGDPYVVMTFWHTKEAFESWVNSDAFKQGHSRSGKMPEDAFLEESVLETFDCIMDSKHKGNK